MSLVAPRVHECMQYPKISLVTQCWNRADTIAETIESVLSQGYPNLEYIVIDDASTDGSWEIIQTYKDRLACCERLEGERTTPVPAINYGLSKATGDVLGWLNAKNILLHKSLFTIADVFSSLPEVEWMTGIGCTLDKEGKIVMVTPVRQDYWSYLIGEQANIQQESTFFRRTLWERTGASLDPRFPNAFDIGLWCTKFFHHATLYHVTTLIGAYRKSAGALSSRRRDEFFRYIEEARNDMRKRVPRSHLVYAELYRMLKYAKPLLRNVPDSIWARLPLLKMFSHRSISYRRLEQDRGVLEIHDRNPFRTIYPW